MKNNGSLSIIRANKICILITSNARILPVFSLFLFDRILERWSRLFFIEYLKLVSIDRFPFVRLLFYFRVSTASFMGEWSPEVAVLAEGRDLDLDSRETSLRGQQAAARCNTFRLLTLCVCSRFATQFHGLSVLLLIHRRLKSFS